MKSPFDYVNQIKLNRVPDDDFKNYNPFIAVRALSMDFRNLPLCDLVNKYTFLPLDKKQHYMLLCKLPWVNSNPKWIKKAGTNQNIDELVDIIYKYYSRTSIKLSEVYNMIEHNILSKSDIINILQESGTDPKKIKKLMKDLK